MKLVVDRKRQHPTRCQYHSSWTFGHEAHLSALKRKLFATSSPSKKRLGYRTKGLSAYSLVYCYATYPSVRKARLVASPFRHAPISRRALCLWPISVPSVLSLGFRTQILVYRQLLLCSAEFHHLNPYLLCQPIGSLSQGHHRRRLQMALGQLLQALCCLWARYPISMRVLYREDKHNHRLVHPFMMYNKFLVLFPRSDEVIWYGMENLPINLRLDVGQKIRRPEMKRNERCELH